MRTRLMLGAVLAAFVILAPAASQASLVGDSVDVTVIGGSTFGPDTVVVIDPGNEIVKDDATDIGGNFFGQDSGLGFDTFQAATIDIQGFDIFITLDLADEWANFLPPGTTVLNSVIFQFDLLDFSSGLPLGSVGLGSDDPYFATALSGCVLTDCVDFDSNTVQVEITSPTLTSFTYRAQLHPVPEPGTMLLFGTAALGLIALRRRRTV